MGHLRLQLLVAVAALSSAACGSTIYDSTDIPRTDELVCSQPATHACAALNACMPDDDALHCGSDCQPCTTEVAGATPTCVANTCGYECPAGLLKCSAGCCTAASLAAGGDDTCAITRETRELLCWGANNDGQLGTADTSGADQPTPVRVPLPGRIQAVGVGTAHSCAVVEGGATSCWGRHSSFFGGADYVYLPTEVHDLGPASAIGAGGGHTCALVSGGGVRCAGSWNPSGGVSGVPVANGATAMATGDDFTCAIVAGSVRCWGANDRGQLGALGEVPQPSTIALAEPATSIALGVHHACAVTSDPAAPLRCWSGLVGTSVDRPSRDGVVPYRVDGVRYPVAAVSCGQEHTCVIRDASTDGVECWGNTDGSAVIGGTAAAFGAPVHVPVTPPVSALAAGNNHTCAIDGSGRIVCWGVGTRGQLGDGRSSTSAEPVPIISR